VGASVRMSGERRGDGLSTFKSGSEDWTVLKVLIGVRGRSQCFIRGGCMGVNSAVRNDVRTGAPGYSGRLERSLLEVLFFRLTRYREAVGAVLGS
jgi:hypothetical protein